jgi:hypothetical protein
VTESYRENGRKKRYDDNSKELHGKRCALQRDRGRRYFLGSKQNLNMTERPRPSWSNSDWKIDGLEVGGWVWCTIMLVFPGKKKTRTIQLRAECGDDRPCDATLYWAMYSD